MGFSSSLQGQAAHEALLNRQDAELRLLDTMRKTLQLKIKCDREYAASLLASVLQGQKVDGGDDLMSSGVTQAWKSMLEGYEFAAKLIKQNADLIDVKVVDKLNVLYLEKRKARKVYVDEHNRISQQFSKLTDDVTRKKLEYQKSLDMYKSIKTRFEEYYVKGGRGGKKLEEMRDKYQKTCRKLHQTHNEYVLLLAEAAEYETDFKTILLPGLVESHQAEQEALVKNWKTIMEEAAKYSSLCTEQFKDLECRVLRIIEGIRPCQEYTGYRVSPVNGSVFTFDEVLGGEVPAKLQLNMLTVDNLTVDWLRSKMTELDGRIKAEQERMLQLGETILSNGKAHDTVSRSGSPDLARKRRELIEMRCDERKLMRQLEMIRTALNELGCEELPSGCELSIDSTANQVHSLNDEEVSPITRAIVDEEWFHGVLPREEVVRLLTKEGDFLVRETTRNDECQTVLSVAWGGHKHFIVQTTAEGLYRFEGPAFPTIRELIFHQYQSGLHVTGRSGAILKKPILRERWELNNDDVILLDKIGRGNFGDVYKARLKNSKQEVAVKTCRVALPDDHKKKFLQEGRILKQYDHPNIVKLIGICVQKQPIMIVMELVSGGSLLPFLRNRAANLTQRLLLRMCRDAAAGMRYLESRNCIHRDLAARNCLIGKDEMVKISDFGMSREEEEYIVSDGMKQIPIKWTAPEALNFGKYTSLCDVWSYGVLAWEIFSKGGVPYPGMSNTKAREKIDSGYRMPTTEDTPGDMYQLMLRCWEYQPEDRPHFNEIYNAVDNLCKKLYPE